LPRIRLEKKLNKYWFLETFEVIACSEQNVANHDEPVSVVREEGDIDEFTDETQNDENTRKPISLVV
jgi:hypothetical protein